MDLFDYMKETTMEKESPLASRMRPTTLDEVVGQEHIIGPGKLLYRAIKADKLGSVIFYGPPGTGKTTLARVIANTTSAEFTQLNATTAGKKDMEEVVKEAQQRIGMYGKKTILIGVSGNPCFKRIRQFRGMIAEHNDHRRLVHLLEIPDQIGNCLIGKL